jgi:ubiquinone/menaquinone biosynthesis C-methylase UbiE
MGTFDHMPVNGRDWDRHVVAAEELARTVGFRRIRDRIVALANPDPDDVVVDIGAGTGLLSLALAPRVRTVWAVDISPAMSDYLRVKAASASLSNLNDVTATAVSLPLVDGVASLVVSNYCYHHLRDEDKERALAEAFRILRPGGRLVIADMMFGVQLGDRRTRRLILSKIKSVLRRGPAGLWRVLKNAARLLTGRWEQPATADWWQEALRRAGFRDVELQVLEHEGGIAVARRPEGSALPSRRDLAAVAA